jgi:ubiquinone/menaquinone biosynthesis C-methylase UbiE
VLRSKRDAQRTYDGLSRWYDLFAGSERSFVRAGIDLLHPQAGERILEVGYGTGHSLLLLARAAGIAGRIYGIDISSGMGAVARERVARAGLADRVRLTRGDAAALPFASGSLDAVFTSFTLELFDTPEIPAVLMECCRVIKPGARMCVVAMAQEAPKGLVLKVYERLHSEFPKYVDCRPIALQSFLSEANLRTVQTCRRRMWGLPVEISLVRKDLSPRT